MEDERKKLKPMLAERFRVLELCREENKGNDGGATPKHPLEGSIQGDLEEPPRVLPVERLRINVEVLKELTAPVALSRVRLRPHDVLLALYLTSDASGTGVGSALIKEKGILYESETWTTDWKNDSSNFREADSPVTKIEFLLETGDIQGQEVLLFIVISTFELT